MGDVIDLARARGNVRRGADLDRIRKRLRAQLPPDELVGFARLLIVDAAFGTHPNPMPDALADAMVASIEATSKLATAIWQCPPPKKRRARGRK